MGMSEANTNGPQSDRSGSSDSKSPLQAMLARGALGAADAKDFEAALKHKQEHAEHAAELLAARWAELPKDLQVVALRWKWQERKPKGRAWACMYLGAAVAKSDPVSASGLLGEAVRLIAGKVGGGARPGEGGGTAPGTGLRASLRRLLFDRWMQPVETAPLFAIRYSHIAREARSEFDTLLNEVLSGQPAALREAVTNWLESQLVSESSSENRHAVEAAMTRLRLPGAAAAPVPAPVVSNREPQQGLSSNVTAAPRVPPSGVADSKPESRSNLAQGTSGGPMSHPKVLIADALRVIQTELKRWSSEDGSELLSLRRRTTDLDESLKRRTQERDELATSLGVTKERFEQQERSLAEVTDHRNRALRSAEVLESELRHLRNLAARLETTTAEAKSRNEQLERDLERVKEDKRRDVEYTRDTERTAMAQELGKAASIHIENMKDLLQLEPSEKQRTALRSCREELTRALRLPAPRLIG